MLAAPDFALRHLYAQMQALDVLNSQLHKLGSCVWVSFKEAKTTFEYLASVFNLQGIYSHQETGTGRTFRRDKDVAGWCEIQNIPWVEFRQSPVSRAGKNYDESEKVLRFGEPLPGPDSLPLPPAPLPPSGFAHVDELRVRFGRHFEHITSDTFQPVSESAAWECLESFLNERGEGYRGGISSPNSGFSSGSRLSAHLAWGTVSARQVFNALEHRRKVFSEKTDPAMSDWKKSLSAFQSRLFWRDHFMQRFETAWWMETQSINSAYEQVRYQSEPALLDAWMEGKTGFPLVDACIRCLNQTGFLNFRMRAMVTNVACFGLHLSWRDIQYPLARLFYDYEPGIHFSQIQMQAGIVGINAMRVYSPQKQLIEQDPECRFVKTWCPELAYVQNVQILAGNLKGVYTDPVVNLVSRQREMKNQLYAIKRSTESRAQSQAVLERFGSKRNTNRRRPTARRKQDTSQLSLFN